MKILVPTALLKAYLALKPTSLWVELDYHRIRLCAYTTEYAHEFSVNLEDVCDELPREQYLTYPLPVAFLKSAIDPRQEHTPIHFTEHSVTIYGLTTFSPAATKMPQIHKLITEVNLRMQEPVLLRGSFIDLNTLALFLAAQKCLSKENTGRIQFKPFGLDPAEFRFHSLPKGWVSRGCVSVFVAKEVW